MNRAILIFSKSADSGRVKTRLRPSLSEAQCLSLHIAFLKDTIAKCSLVEANIFLYLEGSGNLPFDPCVPVRLQRGRDLGDRMRNAFAKSLERYQKVLIVGTDSPVVPPDNLDRAFQGLDSHDIVLGPAKDGGYYLIALKKVIPTVFAGIPWGTPEVLQKTLRKLEHNQVLTLPPSFDVDEPPDLERLKEELSSNDAAYLKHTRHWFETHNAWREVSGN